MATENAHFFAQRLVVRTKELDERMRETGDYYKEHRTMPETPPGEMSLMELVNIVRVLAADLARELKKAP